MGKSSDFSASANVIDLGAFRERKLREERGLDEVSASMPQAMPVFMPVWVYWVPVWTPVVP